MAKFLLQLVVTGLFFVPYIAIMDTVYGIPFWPSAGLAALLLTAVFADEQVGKWWDRHHA